MKKRQFFALAFIATLFAACSNDDLSEVSKVDNAAVTTGQKDAWVYLNISTTNNDVTRNLNTPDNTENGTEAESKATEVMAIFFDGHVDDHGTNPSATHPAIVTNVGTIALGGAPGQPSGTQGAAFEISKAAKSILIIINPSAEFKKVATTTGVSFSVINAAITEEIGALTSPNNFMMTNAKGALEPSNDKGVGIDLTTHATAAAAESAPLTIKVDRVAAKIRVYNDAGTGTAAMKIDEFNWVENSTNKKYFPVSQRIATWNENKANIAAGALGTFRAPYDLYEIGSYRVDPNYAAADNSNQFTTTDYTDEYYALTEAANITAATWAGGAWRASAGSAYCLENTQVAERNNHAWTTHVIVKAKVYPEQIPSGPTTVNSTDGPYGNENVIPTKGLIAFGSGIYNYDTYLNFVYEELVGYFMSPASSSYAIPFTNALNAFLGSANEVTITGTRGDTQVGAMATASGLKTAFTGKVDDQTAAGTVGLFKYYKASTSYYKIMIKHDNTDEALNELGEFGVVRNSVYDVRIGSIKNLGYPTIPGPSEEKDEDDKAWLSVQIDINPWTWYSQTEHL